MAIRWAATPVGGHTNAPPHFEVAASRQARTAQDVESDMLVSVGALNSRGEIQPAPCRRAAKGGWVRTDVSPVPRPQLGMASSLSECPRHSPYGVADALCATPFQLTCGVAGRTPAW